MHRLRMLVESALPRVLPERTTSLALSVIDRYAQYRRYRRSDSPEAIHQLEQNGGLVVRRGPFQGMQYPRRVAYSRHSIPKLLGCYEEELHEFIEHAIEDRTIQRFVDVGSAEGYYSVGFAFSSRKPVYAFEIETFERRYTRLMAQCNGVEPLVRLGGWCSPATLAGTCPDRSFILCDCEGYEADLFTEEAVRGLARSDLIVELHSVRGVDRGGEIAKRFAATHDLRLLTACPRRAADYPELARLGMREDRYVNEFRLAGQQWAVLTARTRCPEF